ncbi:Transcription factor bHLH96 [Zea mays]|uniref:Transcription factor bHLH96 n=1 Tax=Zea mays TaxID=4577 RepID=A0A3L6F1F2_MAIZE|nr:Transcription factor bHLH96 [Zea mays]
MPALVDAPPGDAAVLVYDTFNAASFLLDTAAFCDGAGIAVAQASANQQQHAPPEREAPTRARKRRRRARSCKSREEAETQRMTHIAVERNRRRQMNEYLAALRSTMPEAYVQRGDQASIVGGAIEFVRELEQQLQCLEAQKRKLLHVPAAAKPDATPAHASSSSTKIRVDSAAASTTAAATSNCSSSSSVTEDAAGHARPAPFARFFTYPQYLWCHSARGAAAAAAAEEEEDGRRLGVADVEVALVEAHGSIRVMTARRPGQLVGLVTALQALRLAVLHLSVTTLDALVLYSISVKVEEGCGLATADDVAAAVHHVICIVDAEATDQQLLAAARPQ